MHRTSQQRPMGSPKIVALAYCAFLAGWGGSPGYPHSASRVSTRHGSRNGGTQASPPSLPGRRNMRARLFWGIPSAFAVRCDAFEPPRFASTASIPLGTVDPQPALLVAPKRKKAPRTSQGAFEESIDSNLLVRALRKQGHQNHQIRKCKQPLIGADAGCFRCPRDEPQMAALRKIVHMLDANPRQAGDFRIGEDLLARLHGNHGPAPLLRPKTSPRLLRCCTHRRRCFISEQ